MVLCLFACWSSWTFKRSGWPTLQPLWSHWHWLLGGMWPLGLGDLLQPLGHVIPLGVCWGVSWAARCPEGAWCWLWGWGVICAPAHPSPLSTSGFVCPCAAFALDLEHLQWQGRGHIWLDLPGVWKFGNGMKLCETDILPFSLQIVCERLV